MRGWVRVGVGAEVGVGGGDVRWGRGEDWVGLEGRAADGVGGASVVGRG